MYFTSTENETIMNVTCKGATMFPSVKVKKRTLFAFSLVRNWPLAKYLQIESH